MPRVPTLPTPFGQRHLSLVPPPQRMFADLDADAPAKVARPKLALVSMTPIDGCCPSGFPQETCTNH